MILYWKQRTPKDKKPIHKIAEAVCVDVERKRYVDFAFDDDFARKDGFSDAEEMQKWFSDPLEYADEEYDVIRFQITENDVTASKKYTGGLHDRR